MVKVDGGLAGVPIEDRFWMKVRKSRGCWNWKGDKIHNGYGRIYLNGRKQLAHRVSYFIENGKFDESLFVCHHCDNKSCVRPSHLFLGTRSENALDYFSKHESAQGEARYNAKLKDSDVKFIRDNYKFHDKKWNQNSLAKKFGVSQSVIWKALRKEGWKHVK